LVGQVNGSFDSHIVLLPEIKGYQYIIEKSLHPIALLNASKLGFPGQTGIKGELKKN
jgi:hypothetical protein